jgi:hypothetical protein
VSSGESECTRMRDEYWVEYLHTYIARSECLLGPLPDFVSGHLLAHMSGGSRSVALRRLRVSSGMRRLRI